MIHGDLKPSNVVIFPDDLHRFTPKLIDFGFTTFGLSDQELVQLAGTQGWRAPEWHHRFFKIEDAKKQDIYSYGKVCWWVLKECPAVPYLATNSNLDAFFKLSLETNPALRPAEVGVLLDLVDSAYRDERWSRIYNFGNNTRMTDSLKSWLRNLLLSQPRLHHYIWLPSSANVKIDMRKSIDMES